MKGFLPNVLFFFVMFIFWMDVSPLKDVGNPKSLGTTSQTIWNNIAICPWCHPVCVPAVEFSVGISEGPERAIRGPQLYNDPHICPCFQSSRNRSPQAEISQRGVSQKLFRSIKCHFRLKSCGDVCTKLAVGIALREMLTVPLHCLNIKRLLDPLQG